MSVIYIVSVNGIRHGIYTNPTDAYREATFIDGCVERTSKYEQVDQIDWVDGAEGDRS